MDLYFANKGTGKTTILAKLARKELKRISKGKSKYDYVISNTDIVGVRYIEDIRSIIKIGCLQKCYILIDEGSVVYNNNDTKDMAITWQEKRFYKLERHLLSKVVIVSQAFDDINITLRRLYDNMFLLKRLPFFTLIKPVYKYIDIDELSHQMVDMYKFKSIFSYRFILRCLYFKWFDSFWLPSDITIYNPSDLEIIPNKAVAVKIKVRKKVIQKTIPLIQLKEGELL